MRNKKKSYPKVALTNKLPYGNFFIFSMQMYGTKII